jgi:hypothetical protein
MSMLLASVLSLVALGMASCSTIHLVHAEGHLRLMMKTAALSRGV